MFFANGKLRDNRAILFITLLLLFPFLLLLIIFTIVIIDSVKLNAKNMHEVPKGKEGDCKKKIELI